MIYGFRYVFGDNGETHPPHPFDSFVTLPTYIIRGIYLSLYVCVCDIVFGNIKSAKLAGFVWFDAHTFSFFDRTPGAGDGAPLEKRMFHLYWHRFRGARTRLSRPRKLRVAMPRLCCFYSSSPATDDTLE